ncbi:hypothetical protein M426DRAFT_21041 [Hypoxylon sp. CI-4A]|nr:hypothetical protein M426DRAFT_21041 [Hypoxylon sp. CI-4A]
MWLAYRKVIGVDFCDENWPTCGTCKKVGKEWSGPSKRVKWVTYGKHTREERHRLSSSQYDFSMSPADKTSDTNSTFRIYAQKVQVPSKPSGTRADLLSGNLVQYLESSQCTGYSLSMVVHSLCHIPPMLESNDALFDATDLLISTWQKLCQGWGLGEIFDLRTYSRTLRSLQKFLFDYEKGFDQIAHSNGIYTILMRRGAPEPGNNFDCLLMLDSFAFLYKRILISNIKNFFSQPEWKQAITSYFDQWKVSNPFVVEVGKFIHISTLVMGVVKRFSLLQKSPGSLHDARAIDEFTAALDDIRYKIHANEEVTIQMLLRSNQIHEMDDPESPLGRSYMFPSGEVALYFANLTSYNIVIGRIRQRLNALLGIEDPSLEAECYERSSRIWRTCRYSETLKPLGSVSFFGAKCVSYMSAPPAVRLYLLSQLYYNILIFPMKN